MDSNSAKEFGAVAFAEVDFEHVVVFDNVTQFNDTLSQRHYKPQRHYRLKMKGLHKRLDW